MIQPRIQVLLDDLSSLRRELTVLKRRDAVLTADACRLEDQLKLAGAVQRDLLRSVRPIVEGVNIQTLIHAAEEVSGDVCDVARLDESHVAILLADATGHGMPAGLLAVFIKQSLRGQMRSATALEQCHTLAEPDKVLERLNEDILEADIQECHFATAIRAVYNEQTHVIRWARGGAPYPILARCGESPRQIKSAGPILGSFGQAGFEVVELKLEPGDRLIFHTDGLDALLLNPQTHLGCSELHRTAWFKSLAAGSKEDLRSTPIERHLDALRNQLAQTSDTDWNVDDLSVVALELSDEVPRELKRATLRQQPIAPPALVGVAASQ